MLFMISDWCAMFTFMMLVMMFVVEEFVKSAAVARV